MNNWASKLSTLTILGFFIFSLISLDHFQPKKTNYLQDLIIKVQELEQSTEDNTVDFQIVFSNAISTLQETASLHALITTQTDTDNKTSETVRIIVKTRTPYLLSYYEPARKIEFYQIINPTEQVSLYQSHLIPPETPPPIFS